jgi:hypothetical protein
MRTVIDLGSKLPTSTLNDRLLTILFRSRNGRCPKGDVLIVGITPLLAADLTAPLLEAKEHLTRMLIRQVENEVGHVYVKIAG